MEGVGKRLDQRASDITHRWRYRKQALLRHVYVLGQAAVEIESVNLSLRTDMRAVRSTVPACPAWDERVDSDCLASLDHLTREFVTENEGWNPLFALT
jgi:hypothetical protein